jgi:pimeloyl-ACP methyl ester carboxylesterase
MTGSAIFRQGKIAYRMAGEGRCVVLLHGFLESSAIWDTYLHLLCKQYRVIAIDLPGHGSSDSFGYVHDMEMMALAVKAVLDKLGLRKYVMIGHSMGGYVALAFAELFPDHLRGLSLFHSTASADSADKRADRDKAIEAVKKNAEVYVRAAIPRLFHAPGIAQFAKEIVDLNLIASSCDRRSIIACLEGMKQRKNREMLLEFAPYPVLFLMGLHDPILPLHHVEYQFALPENAMVCILKQSAHMGFIEEKKTTLKYLRVFIRRCHAPSDE